MALDLVSLAQRAAELGGEEAIASVSLRRALVVQSGPEGTSVPPQRTFDLFVRLLIRDGAGRIGVAQCTNSTTTDQLIVLGERAHEQAAASHTDLSPLPRVAPGPEHTGFDEATAQLDPHEAASAARVAATSIGGAGLTRTTVWQSEAVEFAVADSAGALVTDRRTGASLWARATDADGHLVGVAQSSAAYAAAIDADHVGDRATPAAIPLNRTGGPLLFTGHEPVVLLPPALAPLLEHFARVAATGHAHAIGTSPFTGRIGTPVAAADITLGDLPQFARTLPRSIDVAGSPAWNVPLISGGFADQVVFDTASAHEAGFDSTGHEAQLGGSPTGALPRNLVLSAGDAVDVDELLAPVERAVVVSAVDAVVLSGDGSSRFTAIGRAAYLVVGGRPKALLGDVVVSGDLTDLVAEIDALTVASELVATLDRLPERTQATYCPAVRTRGLNVLLA